MSEKTTVVVGEEVPKPGTSLLLAVAAAIVSPFDCVLVGMIQAGLGIDELSAFLGLTRDRLHYNIVRLDLPIPHDRPRRRGGCRPWRDDELRCAIGWRRAGVHPESIGLVSDRSAAGVRSKMRRIGVPPPERKSVRRVDPATLSRNPPDFGFPHPPGTIVVNRTRGAATAMPQAAHDLAPVDPPASEIGPTQVNDVEISALLGLALPPASEVEEIVAGDSLPDSSIPLDVLRVDDVASAPEVAVASVLVDESSACETLLPVCDPVDTRMPFVGPAELVEQYQVLGPVRNADTNERYVKWISLLYLGGMHYEAMAAYLGRTPSAIQSALSRIQMPRDKVRSKFGWSCDLECALVTFNEWGYVLQRCIGNGDRPVEERQFFWRLAHDTHNRMCRSVKLRNGQISEYFKYKQLPRISIVTRTQLSERGNAIKAASGVQPATRLQGSVQFSLPLLPEGKNEQRTFRGDPPVVRPGLSGNAGHKMPWVHARHGGVARPVAHP